MASTTAAEVDLPACLSALRATAARTAKLLTGTQNPGARVPRLSWTVAETAAHMVRELRDYTSLALGSPDLTHPPEPLASGETPAARNAAANARQLAEFTERDTAQLADMMLVSADAFAEAATRRPPDEPVLTPTGLPMTVPAMASALLGEQLIHGLDIARANGARWPIGRDEALLVIAGIMVLVPDYVDRQRTAGLHISYELRFRGGPRYVLRIDDGRAAASAGPGKADCWISADPVGFLLVGYGRTWELGQLLRGNIVAGGRKPWLGPKFGTLMMSV